MKRITIKAAKKFLEENNLSQVIILARSKPNNNGEIVDYVVTYGDSKENCKEAGLSGDNLKRILGWPQSTLSKYSKVIKSEFNKSMEECAEALTDIRNGKTRKTYKTEKIGDLTILHTIKNKE